MKTQTLAKTIIVTVLFAGAFCWSAAADDATQTWDKNCAACHGKDGKGRTMMGRNLDIKDLTDAKVQASFDDAQATKAIKEGVAENGKEKMKAFGNKLSDDDVKALVAHVRSFKSEQ
jgi:cytochrome c553